MALKWRILKEAINKQWELVIYQSLLLFQMKIFCYDSDTNGWFFFTSKFWNSNVEWENHDQDLCSLPEPQDDWAICWCIKTIWCDYQCPDFSFDFVLMLLFLFCFCFSPRRSFRDFCSGQSAFKTSDLLDFSKNEKKKKPRQ